MIGVLWSPRALSDAARILIYLAEVDPALARSTLAAIRARADWLAETPLAGAAVHNSTLRSFGVLGTPYTIVYRVRGNILSIIRIRHFAQNWRPQ